LIQVIPRVPVQIWIVYHGDLAPLGDYSEAQQTPAATELLRQLPGEVEVRTIVRVGVAHICSSIEEYLDWRGIDVVREMGPSEFVWSTYEGISACVLSSRPKHESGILDPAGCQKGAADTDFGCLPARPVQQLDGIEPVAVPGEVEVSDSRVHDDIDVPVLAIGLPCDAVPEVANGV
jgi:hypothetical protein